MSERIRGSYYDALYKSTYTLLYFTLLYFAALSRGILQTAPQNLAKFAADNCGP